MFTNFENLSDQTRFWIFPSTVPIPAETQEKILSKLENFINSWDSHGNPLTGSAKIEKSHFVIVAVDEGIHAASGCSIDKIMHVISDIEKIFGITLTDRSKQGYLYENNIHFATTSMIKAKILNGEIKPSTIIFDHSIISKLEWESKWMIKAKNSWLSRFFQPVNYATIGRKSV